jgi:hypothetical protein
MADVLFADFLKDPEQYRLAGEFWLKNWGELLHDVGHSSMDHGGTHRHGVCG